MLLISPLETPRLRLRSWRKSDKDFTPIPVGGQRKREVYD